MKLDVNQKVQLFDSANHLIGTFDHIQDAINAGADGDLIRLAAGSYDENVTLNKNIEIDGVNAGTVGTGSRGAESVIRGQVTVSAAHTDAQVDQRTEPVDERHQDRQAGIERAAVAAEPLHHTSLGLRHDPDRSRQRHKNEKNDDGEHDERCLSHYNSDS